MSSAGSLMNPRQVTLDVSTACNLRCVYCAVGEACRPDAAPMDVAAALSRLRAQGYGIVVLTGGEPTLHAELENWLRHARAVGFEQRTIVTNGTRLGDREAVRRLVGAGLTHVNVSFHTCRPALFDELAGVARAFDRARAGLETLLAVNEELGRPLRVHTNLLLMRQTVDHVGETIEWLGSLGVRQVTLEVVRARGAVVGRENEFRCTVAELGRALAEAHAAAARLDVTLNTVDLPPCLLGVTGGFDLGSYVVRREKEIHWVVSGRSEGSLNRDTHVKAPSCADCAFDRWCTGIERTLLGARAGDEAPRADEPFPSPIPAATLLTELGRGLERESASRALDACSLFTPPAASAVAPWLALYAAYARTLVPLAVDDLERVAEALGLFLPPGPRVTRSRAEALARTLERRERVLEERLATLASALAALPCEPPACCARATSAARAIAADPGLAGPHDAARVLDDLSLAWLQSLVRAARSPWLCSALLPELVPYVWCAPDCAASIELARSRIAALEPADRRAATQLLGAATIALGPFVRVVLAGAARADGVVEYQARSLVLLTDPALTRDVRDTLRLAAAQIVLPALLGGDGVVLDRAAIIVRQRGRDVAELPRRLRWASILCEHGALDADA